MKMLKKKSTTVFKMKSQKISHHDFEWKKKRKRNELKNILINNDSYIDGSFKCAKKGNKYFNIQKSSIFTSYLYQTKKIE